VAARTIQVKPLNTWLKTVRTGSLPPITQFTYLIMQHHIHAKSLYPKRFSFRTERQVYCQNSSQIWVATQRKEHQRERTGKRRNKKNQEPMPENRVYRTQWWTLKQNTLFISLQKPVLEQKKILSLWKPIEG